MEGRSLVVLRYEGKVPAMGSCAKCQRKFFVPNSYHNDPIGAYEYILGKFDAHSCNG
jgi:hypothetical protein